MRRLQRAATWLLPLSLLVMAIVAVPLRMLDPQGLPRYRLLRAELGDVKTANDKLRNEVERLEREVFALKKDPAAIERIARDELGMVREGEIVFQFPE